MRSKTCPFSSLLFNIPNIRSIFYLVFSTAQKEVIMLNRCSKNSFNVWKSHWSMPSAKVIVLLWTLFFLHFYDFEVNPKPCYLPWMSTTNFQMGINNETKEKTLRYMSFIFSHRFYVSFFDLLKISLHF